MAVSRYQKADSIATPAGSIPSTPFSDSASYDPVNINLKNNIGSSPFHEHPQIMCFSKKRGLLIFGVQINFL